MRALCHEVQKFVSACEGIQSVLAQGGLLTLEERGVIEESANDLLGKLRPESVNSGVV